MLAQVILAHEAKAAEAASVSLQAGIVGGQVAIQLRDIPKSLGTVCTLVDFDRSNPDIFLLFCCA
jgi:hypothetical protein